MDNYIRVYDNVIHNSQEYIDTFSTRTYKDTIHEEKKDERISFTQVNLGEEDPLSKEYLRVMNEYFEIYKKDCNIKDYQMPDEFGYETVRIKRYLSNDYDRFDDHVDVGDYASSRRFLAFFVYLNNVEEGGETEFLNIYKPGTYIKFKINPKAGRMVVFPPLWSWPHKGHKPVSGKKYLLHSYLHYV
jgi:hypothetical protein